MEKFKLLLNTVKHLKIIQIYYQLYYRIRNKFNFNYSSRNCEQSYPVVWKNGIYNNDSFKLEKFSFLNKELDVVNGINWNEDRFGKLWTYNLNYFDFLNQKEISLQKGVDLIYYYIDSYESLKDGKEPYPTSLRIVNFIKFIGRNQLFEGKIVEILYKDAKRLSKNIEYHLLGNHVLENAFALFFASFIFDSSKYYNKSKKILTQQLSEQILDDGGHFELSPMYHQIILYRLLDAINLFKNNNYKDDELFLEFLQEKAGMMLSFLKNITYNNGDIPMVNDSSYGIAPKSHELFMYARDLGVSFEKIPLQNSGYRKIVTANYEFFIDVGNIGSDYQPGHAHSDTFNFELHCYGNPIIVDTGTSTYEKNSKRHSERITTSHNTVKIGDNEQTQVWGGFRVAKRAKILNLKEKDNFIHASHDGYKGIGIIHSRKFQYDETQIIIEDVLSEDSNGTAKAYIHFAQGVDFIVTDKKIVLNNGVFTIGFEGAINVSKEHYELANGFNKTVLALKVIVTFNKKLKTKILL